MTPVSKLASAPGSHLSLTDALEKESVKMATAARDGVSAATDSLSVLTPRRPQPQSPLLDRARFESRAKLLRTIGRRLEKILREAA